MYNFPDREELYIHGRFYMAIKCKNITQLNLLMSDKLGSIQDHSSLGKCIHRFSSGLICTVFDNGTVQFQGANDVETVEKIKRMVEHINALENAQ